MPTILTLAVNDATLSGVAKELGFEVMIAPDAPTAVKTASEKNIELLFANSNANLASVFENLKAARVNIPVVAIGPAQPARNAAAAIRLGAIEYLSTPLEPALLHAVLEKTKQKTAVPPAASGGPIVGDPLMQALLTQAKQFAASTATVLLRGESGTGKEVLAKFIHAHSPRTNKPFVAVNCAAIPESLLESELFGHEKGAFSGAVNKRLGRFAQADGGTLLLDEISEMDLSLQAKLLRAIQERVIDPVGAEKPVPVDIRLIATTNRKLEEYVAEGKFREDLYFRLNVVAIDIPPLRERTGDIEPLASYFAGIYAKQNGVGTPHFTADALAKLKTCPWKGNVRELENTIHRAVLMCGGSRQIMPEHIVISAMSAPAPKAAMNPAVFAAAQSYGGNIQASSAPANAGFIGKSLADVERDTIVSTLNYCQGNSSVAADILGISLSILRDKLKVYEDAGHLPQQAGARR